MNDDWQIFKKDFTHSAHLLNPELVANSNTQSALVTTKAVKSNHFRLYSSRAERDKSFVEEFRSLVLFKQVLGPSLFGALVFPDHVTSKFSIKGGWANQYLRSNINGKSRRPIFYRENNSLLRN